MCNIKVPDTDQIIKDQILDEYFSEVFDYDLLLTELAESETDTSRDCERACELKNGVI
jgi:hypothetical protein